GAPAGSRPDGTAGPRYPGHPPAEDQYRRERSRQRRAFVVWLMVVLMLASVVGVSAWWLGSGRWTVVPNLTGLQRTAVQATLADADLAAKLTTGHDNSVPSGTVISSDPASGQRALRGSDVTVVVSLGRPVVPDLAVGTSNAEAERALDAADLSPRSDPAAAEFHDTVPEGTLIGLRPAAGTVLTVGAPVTLVISKGPAPTTVPQVRDLPEAEAVAALSKAGVSAQVQREFDDQVAGGRAIGTDPQAGQQTHRGTQVTLRISTALVVPKVVGQPREQALATLLRAGFEPRESGDGAGQQGAIVVSVQPGEGSLVDASDNTVTVQVSTKVVVPDVVGLPVDRARQVLSDAGLNSQVDQFFGGSSSRVIAQSPGASRTVQPGTSIRLVTF
ncbi:MAG: PASTA domain-containing protein, partial [Pseudonocardiaceae bacterium]